MSRSFISLPSMENALTCVYSDNRSSANSNILGTANQTVFTFSLNKEVSS